MDTPPRAPHAHLERSNGHARVEMMNRATTRWLALTGLTVVTFLLLLDDTAVAVAQPTIQRRLGLNLEGLQWVINVYTLTIAAFILLAGQLADRFGRRRVYLTGLAIFTLASLGAGLASTGAQLIVMRAVQGLGAALVTPTALAIIADAFPRGQRATALGSGPGSLLAHSVWVHWLARSSTTPSAGVGSS